MAEDDQYSGTDDFAKSIDEAYRLIRERMAKGGPSWTQKEYQPMRLRLECLDLADFALRDEPRLRSLASELARVIEDAIEDWISQQKQEPLPLP